MPRALIPNNGNERQTNGLRLGLDPRQPAEVFTVRGKNFMVDAEGPFSAFGNSLTTFAKLSDPKQAFDFRCTCETSGEIFKFIFQPGAVFRHINGSDVFQTVLTFTDDGTKFPWSITLVGGFYYFAKKGAHLIEFRPLTREWRTYIPGTDITPTDIVAVSRSFGRLVVLSEGAVHLSAIDNGTDFDVNTGALTQSLAIIGQGSSLGVSATFDGFVVWTTQGALKAEFIDALTSFRFIPLVPDATQRNKYIPISAWCIQQINAGEWVILSKNGFYITDGSLPQPWQPLMSEYFKRNIFKIVDFESDGVIRLFYADDFQWFFISFSEIGVPFEYNRAFSLYVPRGEFGEFNRPHFTMGEFIFEEGVVSNLNYGYIDWDGNIRGFNLSPREEQRTSDVNAFLYQSAYEFAAYEVNQQAVFQSPIRMRSVDQSSLVDFTGLYNIDDSSLIERSYIGLDSFIDVGLYRVTDEATPDRFTNIWEVTIHSVELPEDQEVIDMADENTFPGNIVVDMADEVTFPGNIVVDMGFNLTSFADYNVKVIGTLDGTNVYFDQSFDLTPFVIDRRNVGMNVSMQTFDAQGCTGIYNFVQISATAENQTYHLKLQQLSVNLGGRL